MNEPQRPSSADAAQSASPDFGLPPGNHPLEIAARRGIGPLSPLGGEIWHGHAKPCVTCGQLVRRDATECDRCGQDLGDEMVEKMRAHAGPWYVLEHVRPFPGVSLERIVRQLRRGLVTETSIVRGPATDYQWRFAIETPGLCRYFGRCWNCHEEVSPSDTYCRYCLSNISFEQRRPAPAVPPSPQSVVSARAEDLPTATDSPASIPDQSSEPEQGKAGGRAEPADRTSHEHSLPPLTPSEELMQLSAAVDRSDVQAHDALWDEPPRVAGIRATWVAAAVVVVAVIILLFFNRTRSGETPTPPPAAPGMILLQ